jgi:hypothetical protein
MQQALVALLGVNCKHQISSGTRNVRFSLMAQIQRPKDGAQNRHPRGGPFQTGHHFFKFFFSISEK